MISLFLNTSTKWLHIAILKNNKIVDDIFKHYEKDMSEEALYKIKELFDKNNLVIEDIDEIVCVKGPGSFTGLRIGITIAKTMAYFLNKNLYSVSSLEVLASSVKKDIIVPIIDARRGYVYSAIYDKDYNIIQKESYIKLEDLKDKLKDYKNATFVTTDEFDFDKQEYKPDLENLYANNFKQKENSMTFIPNYLKLTEAEEKLNDRRNNNE